MRTDRSYLNINLNNLAFNIDRIRSFLAEDEKTACVVKGNAYGHGAIPVVGECIRKGIDFFCVATLEEGMELRRKFPDISILIFGYTPYKDAWKLLKYNLMQTITSASYLKKLWMKVKSPLTVHLAIDTGMSRIGLSIDDDLKSNTEFAFAHYRVDGIYTHLSCADCFDSERDAYNKKQINAFKTVTEAYQKKVSFLHYKNSAAVLRRFPAYGNLVRPGIVLYGLYPAEECLSFGELRPILEWKTVISSVRVLDAGIPVGYGNSFITDKQMRIATVSTGYADGYNRLLSNRGFVLIDGKRAKTVGRICMDRFMVDVTEIKNAKEGMIATLIGKDGDDEITVDDMAKWCGTVNYEIVNNIRSRVKRFYIRK